MSVRCFCSVPTYMILCQLLTLDASLTVGILAVMAQPISLKHRIKQYATTAFTGTALPESYPVYSAMPNLMCLYTYIVTITVNAILNAASLKTQNWFQPVQIWLTLEVAIRCKASGRAAPVLTMSHSPQGLFVTSNKHSFIEEACAEKIAKFMPLGVGEGPRMSVEPRAATICGPANSSGITAIACSLVDRTTASNRCGLWLQLQCAGIVCLTAVGRRLCTPCSRRHHH